jgi:hypothetical protein
MCQKPLILGMVFVFSLILVSPYTWADEGLTPEGFVPCEQGDLQGTWSVRVGAKDAFGNHLCWEPCSLTLDALGVVQAVGTYTDCSEVASDIRGGELIISSGCVIEGYIETSSGTVYVATGAIVDDELVLGRAGE